MPPSEKPELSPSRALLSAALSALLWLAAPACSSGGNAGSLSSPINGDAGGGGTDAGAPYECDGGVYSNPSITSTTQESENEGTFQTLCAAAGGVFEIIPHCSGGAHCRGFSYDIDLGEVMQHTCRGANTCAGYNCVICSND